MAGTTLSLTCPSCSRVYPLAQCGIPERRGARATVRCACRAVFEVEVTTERTIWTLWLWRTPCARCVPRV
jgi:hypothetical protein